MITGSNHIQCNNDPRIADSIIGPVSFKALIDSGSTVNTVTLLVFYAIKKNGRLVIQNVCINPLEVLKGYANTKPIEVRCSFDAFVRSTDSKSSDIFSKFFVVSGTNLCLLGYETATKLNLLRIFKESMEPVDVHYSNSVNIQETVEIFPKIPIQGIKFRTNKDVLPKHYYIKIIRYNIPIAFEQDTNCRLKKMELQGIIERADKDTDKITFVSPLVLVPKGRNDFRIVVDYRKVNKAIIREPYIQCQHLTGFGQKFPKETVNYIFQNSTFLMHFFMLSFMRV